MLRIFETFHSLTLHALKQFNPFVSGDAYFKQHYFKMIHIDDAYDIFYR